MAAPADAPARAPTRGRAAAHALGRRRLRALEAICDTFAPGGDGLPSASELGVPVALAALVGRNPRAGERRQVGGLLTLWDSPLLAAVAGAGPRSFSRLEPPDRERVLRAWRDSRLPQCRAAFDALRKGVLLHYYALAGGSGIDAIWERIGYPGPIGAVSDPASPPLRPTTPVAGASLHCDVCVVGSGAGGGAAAAVLAAAGLDVIVLEAGGYYDDADFDGAELSAYERLYLESAAATTIDGSVGLLAGHCLGGGTVVNYSTSFRTPDDIRAEWAAEGLPAFASADYDVSLDAVCERLGVTAAEGEPSARDRVMERGLAALGWHAGRMPRNVAGCDQGSSCGYCGYGCRLGAKQSSAKTWLVDAARAGARLYVRTFAERVIVQRGRAQGVEARTDDGARIVVRARAVVAAAGALHTPALLRRSRLLAPAIGRNLRLHPATAVFARMPERIEPWTGTMQAVYSDEHRLLAGGYGVKYETAPIHPSLMAAFAPWQDAVSSAETMRLLPQTTPIGVLLRDRDGGEVRVSREGAPVVRYRLSEFDARNVRAGVDGAARILEAAGATWIGSAHATGPSYAPGERGGRARFLAAADACGYGSARCTFYSFHIMGSARMGGSPARSAFDPEGEAWELRGLVIADGSAFPTASGVNPMVSIAAVAHLNARALASRLA